MKKMRKMNERLRRFTLSRMMNWAQLRHDTKFAKTILDGYPVFLIVEPCNFCNLKCPLCPTGQRLPADRGIMSMETFTRIIDQLHPYVMQLNLFYLGEPFLCTHLPEMIRYARKHRIKVSVSSNMNVFDEMTAESLMDAKLDHLVVSLDGTSQESYVKYRIDGDYDKVISNIKLLVDKKRERNCDYPRIDIQFVVFKHNENEVSKIKELAKDLGVGLYFREGAIGGKGQSPPVTKDRKMAEQWLSKDEKYHKEYDYFSDKPYLREDPCGYLWSVATINWDGSVFPCCWVFENRHSFGNIMEQDFSAIWNNELFRSSRRIFQKDKNTILKELANKKIKETICHKCKMARHVLNDK